MNIAIVGAGIGGLTTAIALRKKGFNITVFEQALEIKAVGAGIIMAHNANQVFQHLGLYEQVRDAGHPLTELIIANEKQQTISAVHVAGFNKQYNTVTTAIRRSALHHILMAQLQSEIIRTGHQLTSFTQRDHKVEIRFSNNETGLFDLLIGADGINSAVRKQLFPGSATRNVHQACWRGLCTTAVANTNASQLIKTKPARPCNTQKPSSCTSLKTLATQRWAHYIRHAGTIHF